METRKIEFFTCSEQSIQNSQYCKFHDDKYWKDNADDVNLEFLSKLNQSITNKTKLSCVGYKLPTVILPDIVEFEIDFANAVINQGNFLGKTYLNKINFFNVTFIDASFSDSIFENKVSFMYSIFENQVYFYTTTFNEVDFTLVQFNDQVLFSNSNFNKSIKFSKDFSKNVDFDNVTFHGNVEFSNVTFHGRTNFGETKFLGEVKFSSCKFQDFTDFNRAEFHKEADFLGSIFNRARFDESKFKDNCGFGRTKFSDVTFIDITFEKQAMFLAATYEKIRFFKVIFLGKSFFSFGKFLNEADFSKITFKEQSHFNRINFYMPERIFFDSDLSKVSFLDTDISRVKFSDDTKWTDMSLLKIYEEDMLERYIKASKQKNENDNSEIILLPSAPIKDYSVNESSDFVKEFGMFTRTRLESIVAVYRYLRENYEYHLKYDDAGKFFIRERELKRNYKEHPKEDKYEFERKNWFSRNISFDGFYYHLAKYGESYDRPLGLAAIIAISSIMFFWFHDLTKLKQPDDYVLILPLLENATRRGLTSFFPLFQLENTELGDYLLRLAMFPTLGALFIALKRKLERRFRH